MSEFLAQFAKQSQARQGALPAWWTDLRAQAVDRLETLEVPTRKDEEWKFVKLGPLTGRSWNESKAASDDIARDRVVERSLHESAGATLVFVNGRFSPGLSQLDEIPSSVTVAPWSHLVQTDEVDLVRDYVATQTHWADDVFWNANTANFEDGAVVLVPRNTAVDRPIHLLFVATGEDTGAVHPRNVIVAGEGAEVTVVEEYMAVGTGEYFHNVVAEIFVGANAGVSHFKVQRDSDEAFHMARNLVALSRDARYVSTAVNMGASLSRNDTYARFEGPNIDCTLDGLAFLRGQQVSDTHTAIDHALPDSRSFQLHKVIVDERAHSVFNGKIFVRQDAQRTRSEQLNQNLLLSHGAHVDTKPQLEILADDVICSHGATVGQLEEDHFFYLISRGLNRDQARALLTFAFAAEVLETISVDSLRHALQAEVLQATAGAGK
jgi:Fe-S cluster assembly protein SufD